MRFGATIPVSAAQEAAVAEIEATIRQMEDMAGRATGATSSRATALLDAHIVRMNSYSDQIEAATSTVMVERLKSEALSVARGNLSIMQRLVGGSIPTPDRPPPATCQPAGTRSMVSFLGRTYRLESTGRISRGQCTFIDLDTGEEVILTTGGRTVVDTTPAPPGMPARVVGLLFGLLIGAVMVGGSTFVDYRLHTRGR